MLKKVFLNKMARDDYRHGRLKEGASKMAKNKTDQPKKLFFEEKEYLMDDLSDESKRILNHLDDIQKKINTNLFVKEQLEVGKESFINMLRESLNKKEEK